MNASTDDLVHGGGGAPPCVGLTSCALPEAQTPPEEQNSHTGVSTPNAPLQAVRFSPRPETIPHWYALRCTYGRERKAYEMFLRDGVEAFYPTITTSKRRQGKNVETVESRLPNILFVYASFEQLKVYVYDNFHDETKYLRFYYNHHHDGTKEPLVIPERQMKSLVQICKFDDDVLLKPFCVEKFLKGQRVLVTEGPFAGVEGVVARFQGQQRVGIAIEGLMTMMTAYVPGAFLERVDE